MQKKRKNAFTLIELLAVIVILAIIALIATPIILGIVEDARKDSFLRSVELVISTTDIDIANKTFEEMYTYEIVDGDISNLEIGVKNTKGMNGTITYDENGNEEYAIHNGVYCVRKTSNMENAEISDFDGECTNIKYTDASCFVTAKTGVYEITDKEKCQTFLGQMGGSSEEITSICNNEPSEMFQGLTLTEYFSFMEENVGLENTLSMISEMGITRIEIENADEVVITDYTCEDTEIVIPSKIDGIPVISIAEEAFQNKGLMSVRFPSSITKIGASAFADNRLIGKLDLSKLTGLTAIENYAFSGKEDGTTNQITSINLPSSVTSIGEYAFSYNKLSGELDLSHLVSLISIGNYAFSGEEAGSTNQITSVKLPSGVTSIGFSAFSNNKLNGELDLSHLTGLTSVSGFNENAITSIKLPSSVTSIGYEAFSHNKLTGKLDLNYLTNLKNIVSSAFSNNQITTLKLPNSVTSIGAVAFAGNKLSGELDLSNATSLTSIGDTAFSGRSDGSTNQITSLKLPSSLTSIGEYAFGHNKLSGELDLSHLTSLKVIEDEVFEGSSDGSTNQITSLKLPSSVRFIRDYAFRHNKLSGELDLSNVTSLTGIQKYAFIGNEDGSTNQITSLKLPSSVTSIGYYAFQYNKLSGELNLNNATSLTDIGDYAFAGSEDGSTNQITSVKLPSSVTSIRDNAFRYNKLSGELDLSNVTSLTNIGDYAFAGSEDGSTNQISSIKLPSGVKFIEFYAFRYNALTSVTFYGRSDLTGITVRNDAWGWADGYSDANIYFVNE